MELRKKRRKNNSENRGIRRRKQEEKSKKASGDGKKEPQNIPSECLVYRLKSIKYCCHIRHGKLLRNDETTVGNLGTYNCASQTSAEQ